jgi:hypothetical protein
MGEVAQQIVLSGVGGDATAAEIGKTSQALGGVVNVSKGMEEQFSHRFTHIGLQLFSTDLLRANGLGGEARQVIGLMQTAIMGAGAAFGAAAGPIMLFGSAIIAVVGLVGTAIEKHKAEAEAIQKVIDAQSKSMASYSDEAKAIQAYQAAGGQMTKALSDLLAADKAVAEDIKSNLIVQQNAEIAALQKMREELGRQQAIHNAWAGTMGVVKNAITTLIKEGLEIFLPEVTYAGEAVLGLVKHLASLVGSIGQHVTLTGQFKQKYDELTASIAKMQMQHAATTKGVTSDINAMTQAQQHYKDVVEQMYLEMNRRREDAIAADKAAVDKENAHELEIMDDHVNKFIEAQQTQIKEQAKAQAQMQKEAKQVADVMGKDLGSAMAASIVEGKNFGDEMNKVFQQMAMQFIEKVITMAIEWAVLQAVMDVWPGGAQAYQTTATAAYPAIAQATYNSIGKQAAGGDYMADKPTIALFGEAGPEIASFRPAGSPNGTSGGGSGGAPTVNISLNVASMDGNDPESTLNQLSDAIRRETVAGRIFSATVAGVAGRYPKTAY